MRTAIMSIALSTALTTSLLTGNLTSVANKNIGQATVTSYEGDNNSLNAGVEQFAGWKIFKWKIWDAAGEVVTSAAAAVVAAVVVDWLQGSNYITQTALLSNEENKIRQAILIEELN